MKYDLKRLHGWLKLSYITEESSTLSEHTVKRPNYIRTKLFFQYKTSRMLTTVLHVVYHVIYVIVNIS